jgi:aminoglycoside 3-N-acetyltransferase
VTGAVSAFQSRRKALFPWAAPSRRENNLDKLREDLRSLGVRTGSILLVQASLRAVKPADGGAGLVAQALLDVLGDEGTLVVPTYTSSNSTTSRAHKSKVRGMTPEERAVYIASLPVFDPFTTPSEGMGALAEYIRNMSASVRSAHPHTSFTAVGARAVELMKVHDLECHLGANSPLGTLYAHDATILMLGTDYSTNTMFHLAEYNYTTLPTRLYKCRVAHHLDSPQTEPDGWASFQDIELDDGDFGRLGARFERESGAVRKGPVGAAQSRLFPAAAAADFAADWMRKNRT